MSACCRHDDGSEGGVMTITAGSRTVAYKPSKTLRRGRLPGFAYMTVAPTLILMVVIVGLPLVYSLYLSFNSTNPITKKWIFVGLTNYTQDLPEHRLLVCAGADGLFLGARRGGHDGARNAVRPGAEPALRRPRLPAQRRSRSLGDGAGVDRCSLVVRLCRQFRPAQRPPAMTSASARWQPRGSATAFARSTWSR